MSQIAKNLSQNFFGNLVRMVAFLTGLLLLVYILAQAEYSMRLSRLTNNEFIKEMRSGFEQTYGSNISAGEIGCGAMQIRYSELFSPGPHLVIPVYVWQCDWTSGQHFVQLAFKGELPQQILQVLVAIVADRKDQLSGEEPYVAVMPEMSVRRPDGSVIQWHDGPVTLLSLEFQAAPDEFEAAKAADQVFKKLREEGLIMIPQLIAL